MKLSTSRSRFSRSCAFVLGAVLAFGVLPAVAPSPSAATVARLGAGGAGSQQPGIAFESRAHMDRDLDAIVAAGMTWVRADFFWATIQAGGRNSFAWTQTDAFVKAATARGLNVLALVAYAPAWARTSSSDRAPPDHPGDYADFVHAAALRYGPMGVHAWEIWNEPNLALFWSPKSDPAAYTALLKRAYTAIKSADPHAVVVTGGLAPSLDTATDEAPMTFLTAVYAHGGRRSFDAVGYHPYSFPYPPMFNAPWNTFFRTPDFHAIMTARGDGKKAVWGTEFGFPTGTNPESVSERKQADDLVAGIKQWRTWKFVGPLFLYTVRDSSKDKTAVFDNMGMLRADSARKPSYIAVRRALKG